MQNPYPNPLAGRSGYTHELLALLTPEEIKQYTSITGGNKQIRHFQTTPKAFTNPGPITCIERINGCMTPRKCLLNVARSSQMAVR